MKIIEPKVELLIQNNDIDHIAKCAHICYNSPEKEHEANIKFYEGLIKSNHLSMLRHASYYYAVPYEYLDKVYPYFKTSYARFDVDVYKGFIYISTNGQFVYDNINLFKFLKEYEITADEFKEECPELMRYTFCLTTQISTSRELNRCSPNNIAEASSRYIEFGKKTEPTIVQPWWFSNPQLKDIDKLKDEYLNSCTKAFECYFNLIKYGLKQEDARGILPLDTMTKVIYTYNIKEWRHIIDLRYFGTTGKPHPNAKIIIGIIKNELEKLEYKFNKE